MTTFRDSLKTTSYKSVFNFIYKLFCQDKGHDDSKIMEIDCRYSEVYKKLLSLPEKEASNCSIYIAGIGNLSTDVDVCLLDEVNDEIFSLDFLDWADLIDMNIINSIKISSPEYLAHILWEITFWGFSEEQIEKQKQITIDASNEKSCD